MGYTYYQHMVIIPEGVALTFDNLYSLIKDKFAQSKFTTISRPEAHRIHVQHFEWTYYLTWSDEAHVAIESAEIAHHFASKRDDQSVIASSKRRIEGGGDADPNMDYFGIHISVREVLEAIPDVYHFDSHEGQLWKTGEEYWKKQDDAASDDA